jgi:fumarylacetoacetate (FAA) hydrolase family protein
MTLDPSATLPADATLAGRIWRPDIEGSSVVAIRADGVFDVTKSFPTMRDLDADAHDRLHQLQLRAI